MSMMKLTTALPSRTLSGVLQNAAAVCGLAAGMFVTSSLPGSAQAAAAGAPSGVAGLSAHRAAYEIKLASSRSGTGPAGATGLMAYEFADVCDGWTVENRIVLDMVYEEEEAVRIDWAFTSWEAKDGSRYRFRVKHTRDGEIIDDLKGEASLEASGKKGQATFSGSAEAERGLTPGTLFPTAHLLESFKAAEGGKVNFFRPMFDGGSLENPYEVNVHMSDGKKSDARVKELLESSGFKPSDGTWRFRVAFFSQGSKAAEPAFEMDVDYRRDGIAERILQDFGDFTLLMRPVQLTKTPPPDC